jgi:hypothetical protein
MDFVWAADIVKNCIAILSYGFCFSIIFLTLLKLLLQTTIKALEEIMISMISIAETKVEEWKDKERTE